MGFSGKIDDHTGLFFFKELIDGLAVADIGFDEAKIRLVHDRLQRRQIAGVSQFIEANNPIFRMCFLTYERQN